MELLYSQIPHPLMEGRKLRNPRFFTAPEKGAKVVHIVGYWPAIEAAYRQAGATVHLHDQPADKVPVVLTEAPAGFVDPVAPKPRRKRKS